MTRLPLEGIRILDSTYIFAMPYACGILTDLGAEVIKIEGPGHADAIHNSDSFYDNNPGADSWNRSGTFSQLNRGKKSLTLDLSKPEGREVLKELIKVSDILVENFTPRVMRGWGLDYANVKKLKPDIIMVSNTGFGHGNGPYALYPGQATSQEATHGLCHITGYPGDIPSKAGHSYVDFLACWAALLGIASALRFRGKTGKGQWIDVGMYQLGCYFTSEYIMDYIANGNMGERIGNRHPQRAPQGCYPCSGDDQWCVISVGDDQEWATLCQAMRAPDLANDPRFRTLHDRKEHHDELDRIISQWTKGYERYTLMELLQGMGVPAGAVFDAQDTSLTPHYWARGFLEKLPPAPERKLGATVLMGRPWQLSKLPLQIKGLGPKWAQHNDPILRHLVGLDDDQIGELQDQGIIGDVPLNMRRRPQVHNWEEDVSRGALAYHDPDYKTKLGI